MTPPLQSVTASNTSKGRPRRHFAECRASGERRKPTKSKPTLPQRTQKYSSVPSRKSTALPSHAPCRSCQLTAQPCLRRRAASMQGGGNTSAPCSTNPPLWTPLCLTRSHRSPRSPASTSPQRSMKRRKRSDRPAQEKSPGMDGIPAENFTSAGPVAIEALHSLLNSIWEEEDVPKEFRNATFVSLFKNRSSKTDYGNYGGISLLSVAGKILARSSSTASSPISRRKTCRKPSVNSVQTVAPPT